jgi:hypothetical protein
MNLKTSSTPADSRLVLDHSQGVTQTISPMGKMGRPRKQENDFSRWIDKAREGDRDGVAQGLHISRVYLDRLCRGERRPSLAVATAIEKMTHRKIRATHWATLPARAPD